MYIIKYVNYKMYSRFIRQGDSISLALVSAMGTATLLFYSNLMLILNLYCIYENLQPITVLKNFGKIRALCLYFIIFLINFLLVYFNKRHVKIFDDIYHTDKKNKYSDLLFFTYFVGTFLMLCISFIYIDFKKFGYVRF